MDMVWIGTALGGVTGAALGAAGAWAEVSRRAKARQARWVVAAREQITASTQNMRTKNARLQAELDKERNSVQERITASTVDQRAAVSRLEGQLTFAYAEIDRLTADAAHMANGHAPDLLIDGSGFALTRPFER